LGSIHSPLTSYPIFAQEIYETARDETGRIVCANCHLSELATSLRIPSAVSPYSVFDAVVGVPYEPRDRQITGNGTSAQMNVGAVLVLPDGFRLAPKDRISTREERKTKGTFIQPYSRERQNILVVGPVSGQKVRQRLLFPVIAPEPKDESSLRFLTYPVYAGANRGRGQLYPTGQQSNNNITAASNTGLVKYVRYLSDGRVSICLRTDIDSSQPYSGDGSSPKASTETESEDTLSRNVNYTILPLGSVPIVKPGMFVKSGQLLSFAPNVGGFGQSETELVVQKPSRLDGLFLFVLTLVGGQIFLVNKKKQYEKVQAVELNF
jgi:apocytochrome f